ncbi:MAG: helix-turn-helix domain-containing protein [Planctomycetes bacterium]|nr:helix-turn-helix domain-containing protein [Planctomycetota bacterium]
MIHIGEKIKRLRGFRGLTCEALAERVSRTRPYLSSVENGHNPPTRKLLEVIARELSVDVNYFSDGAEEVSTEEDLRRLNYFSLRAGLAAETPLVELSRLPVLDAPTISRLVKEEKTPADVRGTPVITAPKSVADTSAFAFKMVDNSMEPRIYKGDHLIVAPSYPLKDEHLVVACVGEDEVLCRVYKKHERHINLLPLNRSFPARSLAKREVSWAFPVVVVVSNVFNGHS